MTLQQQFENNIQQHQFFSKKDKILVAVSGGIDSVVLCQLLHQGGFTFAIAHCNFTLRQQASNEDEAFVKAMAERYKADFFSRSFDTHAFAENKKIGIQEAARTLRYSFFTELVSEKSHQLYGLVTAHHADDNVETCLMNFFKGTGLAGLQGMAAKSRQYDILIIRPLLIFSKTQLIEYAGQEKLLWREDASNATDKYTRNYFRNTLIPGLQKVFPQVEQNILGNMRRFAGASEIYQYGIQQLLKKQLQQKGEEWHWPVWMLLKSPGSLTLLYEFVKNYGFLPGQVPGIMNLCQSETGKYVSSETHRIFRNRRWLVLAPLGAGASHFIIDEERTQVFFDGQVLKIKKLHAPVNITPGEFTAQLDAGEIQFPLLLRKYKTGDYFYPLGLAKKKKLSRFFIDKKLSVSQKEKVWVIESQRKIVWVIGYRIDDRFKITARTKNVLQLSAEAV